MLGLSFEIFKHFATEKKNLANISFEPTKYSVKFNVVTKCFRDPMYNDLGIFG